jgi:16S rRNA (uracil1498-N3)-methyltransferase
MRTIRAYFENIDKNSTNISITDDYYNYFKNVLRLKKNDIVELFNNNDSRQYKLSIYDITNKKIDLLLIDSIVINNENDYTINLYISLIKMENFELVIQKATELGVDNIFPIVAEYSNMTIDSKSVDKKLSRWSKIATSASEQSRRVFIPTIHNITNIRDLSFSKYDINMTLCPYTQNDYEIESIIKSTNSFNIFIGPEGGFSDNEMELFKENNFTLLNLGKRILKAETAPINILSIINFLKNK